MSNKDLKRAERALDAFDYKWGPYNSSHEYRMRYHAELLVAFVEATNVTLRMIVKHLMESAKEE